MNYKHKTYEVIGALLARQSTLSIELARNPSIWNPHISPVILRSMTDALITVSWLMKDNYEEKAEGFIKYGLGKEKVLIEHYKAEKTEDDDFKEQYEQMIQYREDWLNGQRYDFLTEVDTSSSWAGVGTRKMAFESNCESLYKFAYEPYSSASHNTWQHISKFNLKHCSNPLHKKHKIPIVPDISSDINYLFNSAKYLSKTFEAVDNKFDLEVETPDPYQLIYDYLYRPIDENKDK